MFQAPLGGFGFDVHEMPGRVEEEKRRICELVRETYDA